MSGTLRARVAAPSADEAIVRGILDGAIDAHRQAAASALPAVVTAARAIARTLAAGGRVLVFGNGGSAAEAQHFAAELCGRFERDRRPVAAIALTTDTSALTAIANDYGFEQVFARQVIALGRQGDAAVGITTSGGSANVVTALRAARDAGLTTIALTGGDGGTLAREALADHLINVPNPSTARVQEVQLTLLHALCALVEAGLP